MDFNVKKFVGDAGQLLSRAIQKTEETLLSGEKTTLDPQLEGKCRESDATKNMTQRIMKDTEAVLQPNPGNRVEDFLLEKIEKKRPARLTNLEYLGQGMVEAGNEFGATAAYGSMLIKVGQTELKLGKTEREFIQGSLDNWIEPLNRFLENEVKVVMHERKTLENRRLDLDAAKNRLRKARSMSSVPKDGVNPRVLILQAEQEVIQAQSEFTQQSDIVKAQIEVLNVARDRLLENLKSFIQSQTTYYLKCHEIMQTLNKEIGSIDSNDDMGNTNAEKEELKGKIMYDYEAKAKDELTVFANEIITIEDCDDSEYFIGIRGNSKGKVPKSCILVL